MKIKPPPARPEPEPPPKFGRFFWCMTCNGDRRAPKPVLTIDDAKRHLLDVHGINATGSDFQGRRILSAHCDAPTWSSWITHWKIGEVMLCEEEVSPRKGMGR